MKIFQVTDLKNSEQKHFLLIDLTDLTDPETFCFSIILKSYLSLNTITRYLDEPSSLFQNAFYCFEFFSLLCSQCPGNLFPYFSCDSNSWWYIIFYINLYPLVMKIMLHSNVTHLLDFTNCVYLCQNLDKK